MWKGTSGKILLTIGLFHLGGLVLFFNTSARDIILNEDPKFVVFSSDDWGRWADSAVIWPDLQTKMDFIKNGGIPQEGIMAWESATVETRQSMINFFQLMEQLNSKAKRQEHKVVLTPFFTVGGPDFKAMRNIGCPSNGTCEYKESLIDAKEWGLSMPPFNRGDLRSLYKMGFEKGLWHPEYHGLAHFNYKNWAEGLKNKDPNGVICFNLGVVCLSNHLALRSENLIHASLEETTMTFRRGTMAFENFLGYKARAHSSPHNLSGQFLVDIATSLGFVGIDSFMQVNTTKEISKFKRMRFDPFATDFVWEKAWGDMRAELNTFGNVTLAYHAQNTFDYTYSKEKHQELLDIFARTVESLRQEYPTLVFVTSSELHQIQTQGWSEEIWSDGFVFRNYNKTPIEVTVRNLRDVYNFATDWTKKDLRLEDMNGVVKERTIQVGNQIELLPNVVYKVSLKSK